jgi:hypothetical protein
MSIRTRRTRAVSTAPQLAVVALLVGCAASSSSASKAPSTVSAPAPTSSAASSSGGPTTQAPQAHATEVNPPGDIPDDQVFVSYRPAGAAFTVTVPEGWARSSTGHSVTFTDKLNSITVVATTTANKPTVASVQSSELPTLQHQGRNYRAGDVTVIRRKSGPAVLATYLQDSQPDAVTNKVVRDAVERYSFWGNGTEAVLTLSGPKGADNVDPWRTVSDSLTWH